MTATAELLPVTPADREAAWPFAPDRIRWDVNGTERQRLKWLVGDYDTQPAIQAFAAYRHRLVAVLAQPITDLTVADLNRWHHQGRDDDGLPCD